METPIEPLRPAAQRLAVYRMLARIAPLRATYAGKFAFTAFIGLFVPLAVFIVYLVVARADWYMLYPAIAALLLASLAGFLWMLWVVRELLAPVHLAAEALRGFIERRAIPNLPKDYPDPAGHLMEGTQYTLMQLAETINRLEQVSDTDELTGIYNRRAGEKRLAEEVARAERDLLSFQVGFIDVNELKMVNDRFGHSAGDACISHVAALLELNTRRGDWVARWGGDEFVVGLHRNRAQKLVFERIVHAIETSPCEIAPGEELVMHLSCGVAEYRFGSGAQGIIADADTAMYAAKELARQDGGSHVCYRQELEVVGTKPSRSKAITAG